MARGFVLTDEFEDALARLRRGENLFLTGKAGTGKSTLIRRFIGGTDRNVVVAAPTGIAALNVGGYTIHRLFSFPASMSPETVRGNGYYPGRFAATLKDLDTLIIDEASMVRADLFDCLAIALERFGPRPGEPFGGVQMVLVGDLYQLPPVVSEGERGYFESVYASPYFFAAKHYALGAFPMVELSRVFRQVGDPRLVEILNAVREGALLQEAREVLNTRTDREFVPPLHEFWLTLTTTNRMAASRNRAMLGQLPDPECTYPAEQTGDLDGFERPTEDRLTFKTGAQVMMLTNDPWDRWVNGTIARIVDHYREHGEQVVVVELPDGSHGEVRPHTWEVTRPAVHDGVLHHDLVGTYTQLPFRLAWAVTIHKSQGQTLDRVVVDLTGGTFADGQLYVALSRCTSMDGLVLRRDVLAKDLKVDQRVRRFLSAGRADATSRGEVYIGMCTVGDVGQRWRPRPAEIALVTDDGTELTTLVNPTRDMGEARREHGITAADVQLAPLLTEAWAALEPHLEGRTPVGPQIDRDLGWLDHELKRMGSVVTMPLGHDLPLASATPAQRRGLAARTALERARTVREIARSAEGHGHRAEAFSGPAGRAGYLMPRRAGSGSEVVFQVIGPSGGGSAGEAEEALAGMLGAASRRSRLDAVAQAVVRVLEHRLGRPILDESSAEAESQDIGTVLHPGARVCFTGTAIDPAGRVLDRLDMEELAVSRGLVPVATVTKTRCDALICAEAGSQSRKAQNAVRFAKPVFTADEFLAWAERGNPPDMRTTAQPQVPSVVVRQVPNPR
ncbi:AAA family ATPase [Kocuria coralli]|uniref:AAA family ATPase n=1 Tax=Kocuria coralli TaxID=1461025 RepID=A0A5J5L108_9MICC|nr:AAA family ATPase [Kocuria coralli]KAA9394631.1 AAA family ATPase [Kocuria coralli]